MKHFSIVKKSEGLLFHFPDLPFGGRCVYAHKGLQSRY